MAFKKYIRTLQIRLHYAKLIYTPTLVEIFAATKPETPHYLLSFIYIHSIDYLYYSSPGVPQGPVFGLLLTRGTLLTAGRDGHVYAWIWSKNMDRRGALKVYCIILNTLHLWLNRMAAILKGYMISICLVFTLGPRAKGYTPLMYLLFGALYWFRRPRVFRRLTSILYSLRFANFCHLLIVGQEASLAHRPHSRQAWSDCPWPHHAVAADQPPVNHDSSWHGGPSEAGDCSHPPPKMATAKNACSCKATFDHVIWIGSLRFLACEQVLDIANPWYSNERSSRDSLASRGTRIFQREAGDSMAPDRRRRVTHGREAGDSYFRFNFCELLFRCHTQY